MIASIKIKFTKAYEFSKLITSIQSAGWIFSDKNVKYQFYRYPSQMLKEYITASEDNWPEIMEVLNKQATKKHIIDLILRWNTNNVFGYFIFSQPDEFTINFFGSQPGLDMCSKFTDYSWILSRIICPLVSEKYSIFQIICEDYND